MKAIGQRLNGRLLEEGGRCALLLSEAAGSLLVRYALVRQGTEEHILPAFLLDDWGTEIKGLRLYRWIEEHGDRFPRAELFGFDVDGSETQLFLREMELHWRYPCYAYPDAETPLAEGRLLERVLFISEGVSAPEEVEPPRAIEKPLRRARVGWWAMPPLMDETFQRT